MSVLVLCNKNDHTIYRNIASRSLNKDTTFTFWEKPHPNAYLCPIDKDYMCVLVFLDTKSMNNYLPLKEAKNQCLKFGRPIPFIIVSNDNYPKAAEKELISDKLKGYPYVRIISKGREFDICSALGKRQDMEDISDSFKFESNKDKKVLRGDKDNAKLREELEMKNDQIRVLNEKVAALEMGINARNDRIMELEDQGDYISMLMEMIKNGDKTVAEFSDRVVLLEKELKDREDVIIELREKSDEKVNRLEENVASKDVEIAKLEFINEHRDDIIKENEAKIAVLGRKIERKEGVISILQDSVKSLEEVNNDLRIKMESGDKQIKCDTKEEDPSVVELNKKYGIDSFILAEERINNRIGIQIREIEEELSRSPLFKTMTLHNIKCVDDSQAIKEYFKKCGFKVTMVIDRNTINMFLECVKK